MAIILFSVAWGLFHKSSCAQAGLLLGVLFQHSGDDDEDNVDYDEPPAGKEPKKRNKKGLFGLRGGGRKK